MAVTTGYHEATKFPFGRSIGAHMSCEAQEEFLAEVISATGARLRRCSWREFIASFADAGRS